PAARGQLLLGGGQTGAEPLSHTLGCLACGELDRAAAAGRHAISPEVVVHLVVAVGDELPAVAGTDTFAVAGDGIIVEQHGGARPLGEDAGAGVVHDGRALNDDKGRRLTREGKSEDTLRSIA